ncbi:hypothetical protein PSN13_06503 [Micromonospora saelicesensis]|uniref:Uncharacterized protein n=1 Tax=Micromonospora saelicesensis TaxID=285676 RepID=A0A328NH07_9ACTN|nr:DUF6093 family protein [Micromonospora saelicesensis]RAO26475.1 hypothetical protein PSN13_06503 [Micromonospora saelicesensis]
MLDALLARGRAAAEALMTDACVIEAVTGSTTDPESGEVTDTVEQVYAGKCRVQQAAPTANDQRVGEADLLMLTRVLQLPVSASAGIRAGHLVRITACVHDPDLVTRTFVVRAEFAKSHATSRRLGISEATS